MAIIGAQHGVRTRGGFNVGIRLEGQWIRVNDILSHINVDLAAAGVLAQKKFAEEYKDKVQYNIKTGGKEFGYPGHSSKYSKWRAYHGGGAALLFWSEAMHDAVEVLPLAGGRTGVGIRKGTKRVSYFEGEKNKLTISDYANISEHGSFPQPARPVFSDTFKDDMGGLKGLKSYMSLTIGATLLAKGIPVIKL